MAINMSRAPRRTDHGYRGNEDSVGPGSYNAAANSIKVEGERPVPFASGVDKVCCPNLTTSGYTPGPGHYVGQGVVSDDIVGNLGPSTFKSKTPRIGPTAPGSSVFTESTFWKNPGPGSYGTKTEWELALKRPPRCAANPWREEREKTVPSIPLQKLEPNAKQDNSMGENMSNVTMRHTGINGKDTAGPGEYDPKIVLTVPSQPQTSFQGGGPRKDRSLWDSNAGGNGKTAPKENPGPGAYDATRSMSESIDADKAGTHQFASKTVLSHQKEHPDKVAPGPGQYESPGQIDKSALRARAHSNTHGDRTRFGSSVQRVGWTRPVDMPFVDPYHIHNVPGPGSYPTSGATFPNPGKDKEKEALKAVPGNKKKKFHGVHHPMIVMALQETQGPLEAFGSTDDRSCNKVQLQSTPAPWAYDKEEARGHSMASELREKKKLGRNGAFGSLADRFYGSPFYGRDDVPDPGMGETDGGATAPSGANSEPRSMFASQTPRMNAPAGSEIHAVRVGHTETPAPGAYDVEHEISYRSPFRHPRQDHLSFGASQNRFDSGRDIFDGGRAPVFGHPGPGEYDIRLPKSGGGAAEIKDTRKLAPAIGCTTKDVGPGSYGSIDTPMLKKTFNVSTQAPMSFEGTPRKKRMEKVGQQGGFGQG